MGKKKKFIDKKNSATFQLLARDSSDSNPLASSTADRVFVRVDRNPYSYHGFHDEEDRDADYDASFPPHMDGGDPNSIFADGPEDDNDVDEFQNRGNQLPKVLAAPSTSGPLPDHIRRDILELGLPDDGYNYLLHLREIKNTGGGSSFYHNSKAKLDQIPLDEKAYDASKLRISSGVDDDSNTNSIYKVASKAIGVNIQKAVDPDVAALLDDGDLSLFGSDVEDLEEDFIVQANLPVEGEEEGSVDEKMGKRESAEHFLQMEKVYSISESQSKSYGPGGNEWVSKKPRVRRLLDEQFDLLALREYDTDSESDDVGSVASEDKCFTAKLNNTLKDDVMDDLDLNDKYRVPGDFLHQDGEAIKGKGVDSDVIRRCAEYAEMYCKEDEGKEDVVVVQESSDESEVWDCETIISTYSNLDNHPGKIQDPEKPRKKLTPIVSGALNNNSNIISLRGKEKLPVDFLPQNKRAREFKKVVCGAEHQKRRPHGEESKEEKKQRKSAVKGEKREARRAKKEMKGLYRCEAQKAQRVAAISGPSSVHLM